MYSFHLRYVSFFHDDCTVFRFYTSCYLNLPLYTFMLYQCPVVSTSLIKPSLQVPCVLFFLMIMFNIIYQGSLLACNLQIFTPQLENFTCYQILYSCLSFTRKNSVTFATSNFDLLTCSIVLYLFLTATAQVCLQMESLWILLHRNSDTAFCFYNLSSAKHNSHNWAVFLFAFNAFVYVYRAKFHF